MLFSLNSFDSNGNSQPIYEILHNLVEEGVCVSTFL